MNPKKKLVSGITISGNLTIAHYLIVIKHLRQLANDYELFLFIADFHAITTVHNSQTLQHLRLQAAIQYLACGIPPEAIFVQSEVAGHTELAFLLGCHVPLGELSRMTQFKSKSSPEQTSFALLNYPLLMAADILLYDGDVLVGSDQKQHVELTRNLAERLNRKFGSCFHLPELITTPINQYRIRDLQSPEVKMSKSADKPQGILFLSDDPETIRQKIKTCVTDSENNIYFDFANKPGISNLILLYALCSDLSISEAEINLKKACQNYLELKNLVSETIIQVLAPVQKQIIHYAKNPELVSKILAQGNQRAQKFSNAKMRLLSSKIGFSFHRFQD
ncbi:MAG: tryptophan--tRNA ligase [Mollicutes bacterium]|nr:MAG: tryptophan--tRNA ligase [Mollicutes bacterium]